MVHSKYFHQISRVLWRRGAFLVCGTRSVAVMVEIGGSQVDGREI